MPGCQGRPRTRTGAGRIAGRGNALAGHREDSRLGRWRWQSPRRSGPSKPVGPVPERGVLVSGSQVRSRRGHDSPSVDAAGSSCDSWDVRALTRFLPSTWVVTVVTLLISVRHVGLGSHFPGAKADVTEVTNRRSASASSKRQREALLLVETEGTSLREQRKRRREKEAPLEFDPGVVFRPSHAKEEDLDWTSDPRGIPH